MADFVVTILTPWVGNGTQASPYHPALTDDYPAVKSCVDITGQPSSNLMPAPNLFVVEAVVDDTTLAKIAADARYQVLSQEPVEVPDGA